MADRLLDPSDFKTSVVAVPPIALTDDLSVADAPNRQLIRHIEDGGVRILLFGGNANLYHYSLDHYAQALAMMQSAPQPGTAIISSIGPDFGKAMDQIPLVERAGLSNVMLLPTAFPSDSHGIGDGVRRIVDRLGRGLILYIKRENYIRPVTLARLINEGAVRFVKYAVEKADPGDDPYLDSLLAETGPDLIASGMGETPVADHVGRRGLATFTSGAVCIAPAATMRLLELYKAGRHAEAKPLLTPFLDFERVRSKLGGLQVLHAAVSVEVADMGPPLPMVSRVKPQFMDEVKTVSAAIAEAEREARASRVDA